jgi:hypothetical protein
MEPESKGTFSLKSRSRLEKLSIDENIILKWTLQNKLSDCKPDSSGSGWTAVTGCCEDGEHLGSPRDGEFLEKLGACHFLEVHAKLTQ